MISTLVDYKKVTLLLTVLLAALAIPLLVLNSTPASAQSSAVQLLANGDFEQAEQNWTGSNAEPGSASGRAGTAIQWHSFGLSAVYQQVPVTPGTTVRLSAWTKSSDALAPDTWIRQRVGIDPTGGTNPASSLVIWSLPGQFTNEWGQLVAEAAAQSETITVYLSQNPNVGSATVYFDDALLTPVAYPVGPAVPLPAPTVDPLIIGLVDGSGVAPGGQGYASNHTDNYTSTNSAPSPTSPVTSYLMVLVAGVGLLTIGFFSFRKYRKQIVVE